VEVIGAQVGRGQVQFQEVLPAGQVQRRRRSGVTLALFQEVGDVFAAVSVEAQGVLEGAGHLVGAVELAQRHDLLNVVGSVETFFPEFAAVDLGLWPQAQESLQAGLITGSATLPQKFLDMVEVFDVLAAVVRAQVRGDKFFVVMEETLNEPVRRGLRIQALHFG